MDKEGKKGVNQGFSIVKALLSSKTVSYKRDICAIMKVSSVYKHVVRHSPDRATKNSLREDNEFLLPIDYPS